MGGMTDGDDRMTGDVLWDSLIIIVLLLLLMSGVLPAMLIHLLVNLLSSAIVVGIRVWRRCARKEPR
jgi:hypothetical protein